MVWLHSARAQNPAALLCAGAVLRMRGACCQTPRCSLIKRQRPRGLLDCALRCGLMPHPSTFHLPPATCHLPPSTCLPWHRLPHAARGVLRSARCACAVGFASASRAAPPGAGCSARGYRSTRGQHPHPPKAAPKLRARGRSGTLWTSLFPVLHCTPLALAFTSGRCSRLNTTRGGRFEIQAIGVVYW